MAGPRVTRLYLRIYLHVVAIVLVAVVACLVVPRLILRGERRAAFHEMAQNWAGLVADLAAERWNDDAALADRVDQINRAAYVGADISVRRIDGTLRTVGGADPGQAPLPSSADLTAITSGQTVFEPDGSFMASPVELGGQVVGYVVIDNRRPPVPLFVRPPVYLVVFLLALLVAVIPLSRSITRPLERLTGVARAYGSGDLSARAETDRTDEIGILGRALAEMAERIRKLLTREKELLANVSHELRSPLARIRVALEIAGEAGTPEDRAQALQGVEQDLGELERLIEDVLTVSRFDLATLPLQVKRLAVSTICDQVMERAHTREATRGRKVDLALEGDGHAELFADPLLLRRALGNLLDNAARYSPPETTICLSVKSGSDEVEFRVIDQGIGIGKEDQKRLFEPFFRTDRSRTRATGGLGIGLVLTRRIVEAHGGRITIESDLGKGTTVRVVIPRERMTQPMRLAEAAELGLTRARKTEPEEPEAGPQATATARSGATDTSATESKAIESKPGPAGG
jgi:signal transduction histidine kinase